MKSNNNIHKVLYVILLILALSILINVKSYQKIIKTQEQIIGFLEFQKCP